MLELVSSIAGVSLAKKGLHVLVRKVLRGDVVVVNKAVELPHIPGQLLRAHWEGVCNRAHLRNIHDDILAADAVEGQTAFRSHPRIGVEDLTKVAHDLQMDTQSMSDAGSNALARSRQP